MKKLMLYTVLLFFIGISVQEAKSWHVFMEIRSLKQLALIAASLGIVTGGTYLMSKNSKGIVNKLGSIMGGSFMIMSGFIGIIFSDVIVNSIEAIIERTMHDSGINI